MSFVEARASGSAYDKVFVASNPENMNVINGTVEDCQHYTRQPTHKICLSVPNRIDKFKFCIVGCDYYHGSVCEQV